MVVWLVLGREVGCGGCRAEDWAGVIEGGGVVGGGVDAADDDEEGDDTDEGNLIG